jgi:hypothetical protein
VAYMGRGEMYTAVLWANQRERDHLEPRRRSDDKIKIDLQ